MSKGKMSLQMMGYMILTLVLTIALLSLFFYYNASSLMTEDAGDSAGEAVVQSGQFIEGYLDKVKSMTDVIAMHPDTITFLESGLGVEEDSVRALMDLVYTSDENIVSMALVSRDGKTLVVGNDMYMSTSKDMMDEVWYMEAKNSHQMPALNATRRSDFSMDKETWVVSISREIIGQDHLGVLVVDMKYNFFETYFANMPLGDAGYAFIIDLDGRVIYHPDESFFTDPSRATSLVAICESGEGSFHDELIVFKTSIGHSRWILVGMSSLENVALLRRELTFSIIIVGVMVLIIGISGSVFLSKRVVSPLEKLQEAMQTIEDYQKVELQDRNFDEISSLTHQYNLMIDKIQSLMAEIRASEHARRTFELKALQSQINPHFLYNTLDTIVWLAEFEEHDKVITVTKSLGSLLRVALRQDDGLLALKEELDHVQHYLSIQKERYEDMLQYDIRLPEAYEDYLVPKLIIQPIVENAIYHGIREKDGPGHIVIEVSGEEEIIISIKDDGVGFDSGKVKTPLGGVGLSNVDSRIKLVFGSSYGIRIISSDPGTEVQVVLPMNTGT